MMTSSPGLAHTDVSVCRKVPEEEVAAAFLAHFHRGERSEFKIM